MNKVVERYLTCLGSGDWAGLAGTLSDTGFERVGPFCDAISEKSGYVQFLEGLVPTLHGYCVRIRRISASDGVVFAEIDESFVVHGREVSFPELLVFDIDGSGLINRVQVFMMRPDDKPMVPGGKAAALRAELGS